MLMQGGIDHSNYVVVKKNLLKKNTKKKKNVNIVKLNKTKLNMLQFLHLNDFFQRELSTQKNQILSILAVLPRNE